MSAINITAARDNFYRLVEEVAASHEPMIILGKRGNAVLVSEEDWKAIQETLFLQSIPGIADSIYQAALEPIEECISAEELEW
jgi:prevent-host-death family protein